MTLVEKWKGIGFWRAVHFALLGLLVILLVNSIRLLWVMS